MEYLAGSQLPKQLSNPYLICDYCGGPYEVEECEEEPTTEHACLSGGDIYADPSLLPFYQNDDYTLWGNLVRRKEGEEGPEFDIRSTFKDDLGHFTQEKGLQLKGLDELVDEQQKDIGEWFNKLNSTFDNLDMPLVSQKDPMLAITTRAGTTTHDPLSRAHNPSPLIQVSLVKRRVM
jgi:hypothetical protein